MLNHVPEHFNVRFQTTNGTPIRLLEAEIDYSHCLERGNLSLPKTILHFETGEHVGDVKEFNEFLDKLGNEKLTYFLGERQILLTGIEMKTKNEEVVLTFEIS